MSFKAVDWLIKFFMIFKINFVLVLQMSGDGDEARTGGRLVKASQGYYTGTCRSDLVFRLYILKSGDC